MASSAYPNRHQYAFLKKLREHPEGLPTDQWPNPATLKRWANHPGFVRAMKRLIGAMRLEEDLMTASAGARAARMLQDLFVRNSLEEVEQHSKAVNALCRMVRVDHLRQKEQRTGRPRSNKAEKAPEPMSPYDFWMAERAKMTDEERWSPERLKQEVEQSRSQLENAEINLEIVSLPNPFPDFRKGEPYLNPNTGRREMPDVDLPADECGKGMDRVTKFFAKHQRIKEDDERRRAETAAWWAERRAAS